MRTYRNIYDATKDMIRVELTPGQGEVVQFVFSGDRAERAEYQGMVFTRKK